VAYSGGVGFSVHNCEHCTQKKVYFFNHPDCCSAAEEEHHYRTDNCENDAKCCHYQENKMQKNEKNINTPHCCPCCVTEYQFYKIQENYFASQYDKLINVVVFHYISEKLFLCGTQLFWEKTNIFNNNSDPPPLLPGGERFIVFIHKLLFYA
jgi:hypothetical protein